MQECRFDPGSGRSSGGGMGNPLQSSCLGNSMDRGASGGLQSVGHKELDTTQHSTADYLVKLGGPFNYVLAKEM